MKIRRRIGVRTPEHDERRFLLHFSDGAVVDPSKCPVHNLARSHWNEDGSQCKCPPDTPVVKPVVRR